MLGQVAFPVNIEAAHKGFCTPYTSVLCHPLFSELFVRSNVLSICYCWKL